jgi:hypothetical protein
MRRIKKVHRTERKSTGRPAQETCMAGSVTARGTPSADPAMAGSGSDPEAGRGGHGCDLGRGESGVERWGKFWR